MSFWTGNLSRTCDERSIFAIPIFFFLHIYFHNFGVKKHLTLYAKQNKSGSESSVSYLKQGGKMSNFCLKQGHGLKASAAQLYPDFPSGQSLLVLKGFKRESTRKLSNFNFQQTKTLYQNNLNNIAFFLYIFQGLKISLVSCNNSKENFLWEPEKINVKYFHKMTPYTLNFQNFNCVFIILLKFDIYFLGLPWEIVFVVNYR